MSDGAADIPRTDTNEPAVPLSIVVVSWNVAAHLERCLASIAAAPKPRSEVIVVDNASSDDSVAMVRRRFPNVRVIVNDRNRGFGPACNQGMRAAQGTAILLLNPDAEVTGDLIPRALAELERDARIGMLGVRVRGGDGRPQPGAFHDPRLGHLVGSVLGLGRTQLPIVGGRDVPTWRMRRTTEVEVVAGCCMFLPRDVLAEVGGFDEAFPLYGEEADWCRRIRDAGRRVVVAPVGEIVHHGGASTMQLGARRGVLLCRGVLQLVRRQRGTVRAAGAFGLCAIYHALRAASLGALGLLPGRTAARRAAREHVGVLRRLGEAWPRATAPVIPRWSDRPVADEAESAPSTARRRAA